ncbi:unnamed protein product [Larinioides sclopetarius]|uniref:Histone-lysine N-methyltransferase eggless n=1 Tax=Larinioides sclopetarius TaxID=280406 RepID=A0AAV1Z8H9_9ARAC
MLNSRKDYRRSSKRRLYPSAPRKKKTAKNIREWRERINASKMPVLQQPVESECVMEVDVAPSLPNYEEMKKAASDTYKKFSSLVNDDPASKFMGLLNSCKTLILCEEKKDNTISKILDTTKRAEEVLKESSRFCKKFRPFFESKAFLFTTELDTIKTHPDYQKLSISLNAAGNGSTIPKKDVPSSDGLEVLKVLSRTKSNLPPAGVIKRKELVPGMEVWVMKSNPIDIFVEGTILSSCEAENKTMYKVRFEETKTIAPKFYTAKQLAYKKNPDVIVPVGTRIAARYTDGQNSRIYAGIVAEPPKFTNHERYLIFFDDGYAQYIEHKDIYVVCYQSIDVADDVHENISEFIRAYLQKYPERPMVKLQKDQITKTEYDRKWWDTRVLDVDASMVKMYFIASQRTEWIYRGSTRLKLLYNELANAEASRIAGKHRRHNIVPRKPHQPYVEYTRDTRGPDDPDIETIELDSGSDSEDGKVKTLQHARRKTGGSQYLTNGERPRNTARKSTSLKPRNTDSGIDLDEFNQPDIQSHLGYKDLHNLVSFSRVLFISHQCCRSCRELTDPVEFKGKNPFLIPIYVGWERQIRKFTKVGSKLNIMYRTPCGKHLRELQEIQDYLTLVHSRLTIDFFSIDPFVVVFRTFRPREVKYELPDVTKGNENVPVCCVNSWENTPPPFVEYSSKRFPGNGVFLNEDKEFLCGCSCTDNCQDSANCECQQITSYAHNGTLKGNVGYKFRRLREPLVTGIFECNSRCKCGPQCGNRVVQNGLQVRLQMFKTQRKGWGIRCLDDIDAGMFICIYAGQLLTEQGADEDGNQFGDEYLAELDHIEVAEKIKEGYESDVSDIEDMEVEEIKLEENQDEDYKDKSESSSSDSEVNVCDTDSEYEESLRSTAVNYTTRSRRKSVKMSDCSSMSSMDSLSNSASNKKNNINKELPDLSSLDAFKLIPRPLSPASEEFLEKTELKRIPKITEDDSNPKAVAKKSLSMKHPGASLPAIPTIKQRGYKSVRSYYGEDGLYIMDAKSKGNIGRYLNHSCAPNVFVQNVFVETHDLRFPEVAFFAQNFIQAGTELTWDYNYEVGSVQGKVMYCYCDARTCRGRLL